MVIFLVLFTIGLAVGVRKTVGLGVAVGEIYDVGGGELGSGERVFGFEKKEDPTIKRTAATSEIISKTKILAI